MTTLVRTHPLVETVSKACAGDEGTAQVLVRMALYDALCDHVDLLRPEIEGAVSKVVGREAARGLQALAKRAGDPEAEQAAEHLYALVQISKDRTEDNPNTPYWDARERGRFVSGRGRRNLGDGLKMLTAGRGEDSLEGKATPVLEGMVGDKATAYSRARVIGNGLTAMNTPETRALGTLARVVGEIGPEAQAALEPGLRRAAYRYRGTERRPDADVQRQAVVLARLAEGEFPAEGSAMRNVVAGWSQELQGEARRDAMQTAGMRGAGAREVLSPGAVSYGLLADQSKNKTLTPDQRRLDAVGQFGVLQLRTQVPDARVASLSLAAGKMPPSVGLLMDKDGRIVSEAMGFNGDHYLPFDLKNLKALKGGQYVRTRTSGGPTDEDIYTGLLTGARQIEVVSNSGVFKVEFDPDLRGGRRYSDKARQMVDRYARLVATIESGTQEKQGLDPAAVREMKQAAIEEATDPNTGKVNLDLAERYFEDSKTEAMRASAFNDVDEDELLAQAKAIAAREWKAGQTGNKPTSSTRTRLQTEKEVFNELKAEAYAGRYQRYRADGEGYKAALDALKQEFPYFIRRVEHTPLADYLIDRKQLRPDEPLPGRGGGSDRGYTPRGGLDPKGAKPQRPMRTATQLRGGGGGAAAVAAPAAAQTPAAGPAAPAGVEAAPATSPTGAAASSNATGREQAKSLLEVAQNPTPQMKSTVNQALAKTLKLRKDLGGLEPVPSSVRTPEEAFANGDIEVITGFLANPSTFGTTKTTEWLLTEATAEQIDTLKTGIKKIEQWADPDDPVLGVDPGAFEPALAVLDQVKAMRKPFADPDPVDMTLADPGFDPHPQPIPEVVAEGASVKNLRAYLAENKDVARAYADLEHVDDEEIASELSESVQALTNDPTVQAKVKRDGPASPVLADIRARHKAWAVKRAIQLATFAGGQAPPPFPAAPAAGAGPGDPTTTAKALGRRPLRVLSPSSPVAKAYASRSRGRR